MRSIDALRLASSATQTTRPPASSARQSQFALQNCQCVCVLRVCVSCYLVGAAYKHIPGYRSSGKIREASRRSKIQDSRFKIFIHSNHLPWYIEDHKISINS